MSATAPSTATAPGDTGSRRALTALWAVAAITLAGYVFAAVQEFRDADRALYYVPIVLGTATMLAAWWIAPRVARKSAIVVILVGTVLFRAVLVPTMPRLSDDMFRYLWDGQVQQAGINPYLYTPDSPQLERFRDNDVYPDINRKSVNTIYPGAAELTFVTARTLGIARPATWKIITAGADILVVWLLIGLLRRRGRDPRNALLYAWNPLMVLSFAQAGHIDVLGVLFLLLALRAWHAAKPLRAGAHIGIATALKLFPLLVMPAFLRRRDPGADPDRPGGAMQWWPIPIALGVLALAYVPYLTVGKRVLGFLATGYLTQEGYASGRRFVLANALGLDGIPVLVVGMVAAVLWAWFSRRPPETKATVLFGAALVLTMPYPWYASYLVMLAVVGGSGLPERAPRWSWLIWPIFAVGLEVIYLDVGENFGPSPDALRQVLLAMTLPALALAGVVTWRRIRADRGDEADRAATRDPATAEEAMA